MKLGRIKRYVEMKQLQGHGYIFGDSGPTILHIPFTLNRFRPMHTYRKSASIFGEAFVVGVVKAIVSQTYWGNLRHQQHLSAPFSCPDYASTTKLIHGSSNGCSVVPRVCTVVYMLEFLRLLFGFFSLSMSSMNPT